MTNILGGQVACGLIALVSEICYARLLGPSSRGLISLSLMSVAFGTLVAGLGGEGTIIFWSAGSKKAFSTWLPAVLSWALLGCTLASTLWALLYWHFHPVFLHGISPALALLVLLSIPAATLFSYAMSLLTGLENFRLRSSLALLRQVAGVLLFLVLILFLGRSTEAALLANLGGLVIVIVVASFLLRDALSGFWKVHRALPNFKPTLAYGVRGQLGNLATFFTYRFDVFIVNYFLDPAQLGLYALGVVISESLWQFPQAVASAVCPRTARTGRDEATRFTCFVMRQVFFISCLGGAAIAVASPLVIPLVFGASFKPSVQVIWWILPGTVALSLAKVACSDLAGRGKNGYSSVTSLICFAITLGLDWFLIPRIGILGAALASSMAYTIDTVLILIALRHEVRTTWKDLLIPSYQEILSYRVFWQRFKAMVGLLTQKRATNGNELLTVKGD